MDTSARLKVLLVDDNPRVRSYVKPAIENAGFVCIEAEDGWTALDKVESEFPNIIVLDIMLGDDDMNGLDVCKKIREDGIQTPVIFLTVKDRTEDPYYMKRAFQLGADDYVSKREELRRLETQMGLNPTEYIERKSDTEELVARIKARANMEDNELIFDNYLKVNLITLRVNIKPQKQWQEVQLTGSEYKVLTTLIQAAGRPVGKAQLMNAANVESDGSLQNHIWRLRTKIELNPENPKYILTYHSIGYRFNQSVKD